MFLSLCIALATLSTGWAIDADAPTTVRAALYELEATERPTRRRLYVLARPGGARDLHNASVIAERQGDLGLSLDLAREAYVTRPSMRGIQHVHALEARLASADGSAATEPAAD